MSKRLDNAEGQCLCGTVKYSITGEVAGFHICYCARCRHATGSAHASNIFTPIASLTWLSGKDNIQRYDLPEAARFGKQFCKTCGSAVPYPNRAGTMVVVPAGTLNAEPGLEPDDKIFCSSRARWVEGIAGKPEFAEYPQ